MFKGVWRFIARFSYFYFSIFIFGYGLCAVDYPTGYCDSDCEWIQHYAFYGQLLMVMPVSSWLCEWHYKLLLSPLQDIRQYSIFWCGICFGGGLIYWCSWNSWVSNVIPAVFIDIFFIVLGVGLLLLRAELEITMYKTGSEV